MPRAPRTADRPGCDVPDRRGPPTLDAERRIHGRHRRRKRGSGPARAAADQEPRPGGRGGASDHHDPQPDHRRRRHTPRPGPAPPAVSPLDAEGLRSRVHKIVDEFLARQADVLDEVSPDCGPLVEYVAELHARRQAPAAGLLLLGLARGRRPRRRADRHGGHRPGVLPGRRPRCTTTSWTTPTPGAVRRRSTGASPPCTGAAAGPVTASGSAWPGPCSPATCAWSWSDELLHGQRSGAGALARGRGGLRPDAHASSWAGSTSTCWSRPWPAAGRRARWSGPVA